MKLGRLVIISLALGALACGGDDATPRENSGGSSGTSAGGAGAHSGGTWGNGGSGGNAGGASRTPPSIVLHVSTSGDDSADGTEQNPLATFQAARDRLRALTGRTADGSNAIEGAWDGAWVVFEAGTYGFAQGDANSYPVVLDERDGGTTTGPIVYKAADGASVVFSGAYRVPDTAWLEVVPSGAGPGQVDDSAAFAKLPEAARGETYKLDVNALGIPKGELALGQTTATNADDQLRVIDDDEWIYMSRHPDGDEFTTDGWSYITGYNVPTPPAPQWLEIPGTATASWSVTPDARMAGSWYTSYIVSWGGVGSLSASGSNTRVSVVNNGIDIKEGIGGNAGVIVALMNFLEGLGKRGRYVWNASKGQLYYRTLDGAAPTGVSLSVAPSIVHVGVEESAADAADHVQFRDLTIEGCRNGAIQVYESDDVTFTNCEMRFMGGENGAVMSENAQDLAISGGSIHHCTGAALRLHGGDLATLTEANIVIDGVDIHRIGIELQGRQAALHWTKDDGEHQARYAAGVTVRNVHIHDTADTAMRGEAFRLIVENSSFENVCEVVMDSAAIMAEYPWVTAGSAYRNNTFTDIRQMGADTGHGELYRNATPAYAGIYLDLNYGIAIEDNTFTRCEHAMNIAGGKHHVVRRNRFIDTGYNHYTAADVIFGVRTGHTGNPLLQLTAFLDAMPLDQPPWSTLYPDMIDYRTGGSKRSLVLYHEDIVFSDNLSNDSGLMGDLHWSDVHPQTVDNSPVGVDWTQKQYPLSTPAGATPVNGGGSVALQAVSDIQ
jgi:hypothetical protein